ncbi:MAG: CoA ester lyase [Candidatus Zixiibacteriota bacterium]|nr:MAG: CoA ester lyase [candidate division Zixibacteria bacterium]
MDYRWIMRSLLFVPGHSPAMLRRAARTPADGLILDLEDAVPAGQKAAARDTLRRFLAEVPLKPKTVTVRVNPFGSGLTREDLRAVAGDRLDGFVYPWTNSPDDLERFDAALAEVERDLGLPEGRFGVIALIESPRAVLALGEIAAASTRLRGLFFGCEDFLAELQGRHDPAETALLTPRALTAMAARAAGLEAVDAPFVRVQDLEGLRAFARAGRDLGFTGMAALTPGQVEVINEVYTPDAAQIRGAREILAAAGQSETAGRNVRVVEGRFVAPPTAKAARKLLERAQAIAQREGVGDV